MKRRDILIGLSLAVILAVFSFLASTSPDGLERVASDENFIQRAINLFKSPFADYIFPGISDKRFSSALAGIFGVAIVFLLAIALALGLRSKT